MPQDFDGATSAFAGIMRAGDHDMIDGRIGRRLAMLSIGAGWLVASAVPAQAYSAFYVFGDSLSDAGNVYLATAGLIPAPPYVAGRFTNGPTWADDVDAAIHLAPLKPSLVPGGTDYAFGYATASDAVPKPDPTVPSTPNVQQQVAAFNLTHPSADASALYAVWIGSNDVINAVEDLLLGKIDTATAESDLNKAAEDEATAVKSLMALGATDLIIGLVPDIGKTPAFNGNPAASGAASLFASDYNADLKAAAGESLDYFDTFSLLDDAVDDPAKYGLTDATSPCYVGPYTGGGTVCGDPDQHLFWDSVHPTEVGHRAIAALALQALPSMTTVPLPGGAALFGAAVACLGVGTVLRRRSAALSAAPTP